MLSLKAYGDAKGARRAPVVMGATMTVRKWGKRVAVRTIIASRR
jgi:hypothetical protein